MADNFAEQFFLKNYFMKYMILFALPSELAFSGYAHQATNERNHS